VRAVSGASVRAVEFDPKWAELPAPTELNYDGKHADLDDATAPVLW
jgi:hypothetical protein